MVLSAVSMPLANFLTYRTGEINLVPLLTVRTTGYTYTTIIRILDYSPIPEHVSASRRDTLIIAESRRGGQGTLREALLAMRCMLIFSSERSFFHPCYIAAG